MTELIDELSRLPSEIAPPPSLEGRVATHLRRHGLLRPARFALPKWRPLAAALALLVAGGLAGYLVGTERPAPIGVFEPRFMLLLLPPTPAAGTESDRAAAYGEWASRIRSQGYQIAGDRLAAGPGVVVGATGSQSGEAAELLGFFVVSAADTAEAVELARTSPHALGGGRIVVRAIDTP